MEGIFDYFIISESEFIRNKVKFVLYIDGYQQERIDEF